MKRRDFLWSATFSVCNSQLLIASQDQRFKVGFLGNSITLHGPKADIGWEGNWGMAASEPSKDYTHLVLVGLEQKWGYLPESKVNNISPFERNFSQEAIKKTIAEIKEVQADLIILAIGENVPKLKTPESKQEFHHAVKGLIETLKTKPTTQVVVRSCFWADPDKDSVLEACAKETGAIYVDIHALAKNERNFGRSERSFIHEGVANHPGDRGMAAIAQAILNAVTL